MVFLSVFVRLNKKLLFLSLCRHAIQYYGLSSYTHIHGLAALIKKNAREFIDRQSDMQLSQNVLVLH